MTVQNSIFNESVTAIENATHHNNHNYAMIVSAGLFNEPELVRELIGISRVIERNGSLPQGEYEQQRAIYLKLKDSGKKQLTEEQYALWYQAT